MKKRILPAIIFTLIHGVVLNAQCWEVVYQRQDSEYFWDVFFINDTMGWVCGYQTILKTTDGGQSWQNVEVGTFSSWSPVCVFFSDEMHGWIGSNGSLLYRTQDGGETWEDLLIPNPNPGNILPDIYFVTPNIGWAILQNGYIYYTENGGQTWVEQLNANAIFNIYFFKFFFINQLKGWVVGYNPVLEFGVIYHTSDGGNTWIEQYVTSGQNYFLRDVHFIDENTGWALNRYYIYRTTNGGEDWFPEMIQQSDPAITTRALCFTDSLRGWYGNGNIDLGTHKGLFTSGDSGISWSGHSTAPMRVVTEIQMLTPDYGWAVTSDGKILRYQGGPAACGSALLWPPDGAEGIPLQPTLSWSRSPGCVDGYRLRIGTAPGLEDLLPAVDVGYDTVYALSDPLPPATQAYISIQPYNHVYGAGETCQSYSFTTAVCPVPMQVDTFFCSGTPLVWADTTWETPGDYELVYALPNGCDSIIQLHLEEEPTYYTEIDTTLAAGAVFEGIPHYADTSFVLLYSAANGCDSLVKVQIRVVVGQREPANATHAIKVYPNPVQNDELIVETSLSGLHTSTARLYTAQGALARQWAFSAVAGRFTLDMSGLPPGVYGLEVAPGLPVARVVIVR
jgi:photosystem II stability/assembly factor-like uncharacterized protein